MTSSHYSTPLASMLSSERSQQLQTDLLPVCNCSKKGSSVLGCSHAGGSRQLGDNKVAVDAGGSAQPATWAQPGGPSKDLDLVLSVLGTIGRF